MRNRMLGIAMVAVGAGLGFLLGTPRGRALVQQARGRLKQLPGEIEDRLAHRRTTGMVEKALHQPHEETAVAAAMERALS